MASTVVGDLAVELAAGAPPMLRVDGAADPVDWVARHRAGLDAAVLRHGALLVRGLGLREPAEVGRISQQLITTAMPEREAFARREPLGEDVLSSLEWPPDQPMCMHHELSYALEFPQLLVLGCLTAPEQGGITALADSQAVLAALPADLVARFEQLGWMLIRSYNDLVGLPWPQAFGTSDRAEAEKYCRANGITFQWQPDGELRTRQRRPAVVSHPVTGQRCWFNQIAFLNESTLDPAVREYLLFEFGPDSLPFTTRYGDGSPIEAEVVDTINAAYEAATLREPWQDGDLLLVDNVRMAHSREPFDGQREIALVLGAPARLPDSARWSVPCP